MSVSRLFSAWFQKGVLLFHLCVFAGTGNTVFAAQNLKGMDEGRVSISWENSFLDMVPGRGSNTLVFQVRNQMNRPGSWTFRFSGTRGWEEQNELVTERQIVVDAKSVKTVKWEIPVFPATEFQGRDDQRLHLSVSGPGASGYHETLFYGSTRNRHDAPSNSPLAAFSPKLVVSQGAWNFTEFLKEHEDRRVPVQIAEFDPAALPSELSGFSGVDFLVMTPEEWRDLGPRRPLIARWVAGGGQLFLLGAEPGRSGEVSGVGGIHPLPYLKPTPLLDRLRSDLSLNHILTDNRAYHRNQWELAKEIPEIKRSFGGIMLAVIAIAALLGPVNVWIAFRRRNSLQVIWTTPLISLALSLLVALGIVFSDGFGGKGQRALYVLLVPAQGMELLVQEQISRTGVLMGDRFSLADGVELYPVNSGQSREHRNLQFRQLPGGWSGDWFENRSIQAQVLRQHRSSRAEVRVLEGGDGAPAVLSTVDATFSRLIVRDSGGVYWQAEQVSPGRERPLRRIRQGEAEQLLQEMDTRNKNLFPGERFLKREGWFYAESPETSRYIDTHPSIRWQDRPVWFMGPLGREDQP